MITPTLTISIDAMRHTVQHKFSQHLLDMDQILKKELDEICKPENLQEAVRAEIQKQLRQHASFVAAQMMRCDTAIGRLVHSEVTRRIEELASDKKFQRFLRATMRQAIQEGFR